MSNLEELHEAAHASNARTHAGHWLIALAIALIGLAWRDLETGVYGAAVAFIYREGSDILSARVAYGSWKAAIRAKGLDGYLDLFFAFLGAGTVAGFALGGLAGGGPAILASAGIWTILYFAKYRKEGV